MNQLAFTDVSKITDQEEAILFYLQSFSFSRFLVEQKGFYRVKQLLAGLAKGTSFPEAFETAFGRTLQDLAGDWQRDLEGHYR